MSFRADIYKVHSHDTKAALRLLTTRIIASILNSEIELWANQSAGWTAISGIAHIWRWLMIPIVDVQMRDALRPHNSRAKIQMLGKYSCVESAILHPLTRGLRSRTDTFDYNSTVKNSVIFIIFQPIGDRMKTNGSIFRFDWHKYATFTAVRSPFT